MCNLYNFHKIAEDTLFYLVNGKLPMSMMGCLYLKKKKAFNDTLYWSALTGESWLSEIYNLP